MKCKPNCAPGGIFSKTRLASCSGEILAGFTGEYWRAAPARCWLDTRQDPPARDTQHSAGSTGELQREKLVGGSGGILGGIHWRATLVGYFQRGTLGYSVGHSAGSTGELLWDTQPGTRRDPLAGCSGGILGGIHWRAALAGYWAGPTGEQLWRDNVGPALI